MSNIVQIPGARAPVINPETGIMNPVWYRFFELLNTEARSSPNPTLVKKVLFFSDTTSWEVPSGVDYCIAEVCGGGGGGGGDSGSSTWPTAGANSTVSCGDGIFTGVGGDLVWIMYMGSYGTCRSGRESSGQSAFFASGRASQSFVGIIPAAVNKFGINLIPGETVSVIVGAGGAQGPLYPSPVPGTAANGGSGFVNIEYWI